MSNRTFFCECPECTKMVEQGTFIPLSFPLELDGHKWRHVRKLSEMQRRCKARIDRHWARVGL